MNHRLLTVEIFVEPMFGENAYVVSTATAAGEIGWIIDPSFPPAIDRLLAYVSEHNIAIEKVVLTHGHADHIAGLDRAHIAHPRAEVLIAAPDEPMLDDANKNLSAPFGLAIVAETKATVDLRPGMVLALGPLKCDVLDTSGHSPGGRSLYFGSEGVVIAGDALFAGSIGRTDFPGSSHDLLIQRICENLLTLPDTAVVYSGHGPATTVGNERKSNPFLSDLKN